MGGDLHAVRIGDITLKATENRSSRESDSHQGDSDIRETHLDNVNADEKAMKYGKCKDFDEDQRSGGVNEQIDERVWL